MSEEGCMTKMINEFTSKDSDSENIITILPELLFSNPFWNGFVQGVETYCEGTGYLVFYMCKLISLGFATVEA